MADRMLAQTAEDVRRAAERCLTPGLAATAVLGPKLAAPAGEAFHQALFG
jgi:predicted Zn-dependent peptidase